MFNIFYYRIQSFFIKRIKIPLNTTSTFYIMAAVVPNVKTNILSTADYYFVPSHSTKSLPLQDLTSNRIKAPLLCHFIAFWFMIDMKLI